MEELKTENGRRDALILLEEACVRTFQIEISEFISSDMLVSITSNTVTIGVKDTNEDSKRYGGFLFGSELSINIDDMVLNVPSSSNVCPDTKATYWKLVHAGELLKYWDTTVSIIKEYTQKYDSLIEEIFNLNS